ncbi:MAG: gpW family head-tail joining protein [Casimicrobium sp.]
MPDCASLQAKFTRLDAAHEKLLTGARVVKVQNGDDVLEYSQASIGALERELDRLQKLILQQCGIDMRGEVKITRYAQPTSGDAWRCN